METMETNYYLQTLSFFIASIVGLSSMLYNYLTKKRGFTLHLVGIGRPANYNKSQYHLLDNINTQNTMITLHTHLQQNNTLSDLKQLIKHTYNITNNNDLLILFSHHIITDDKLTLTDIGITHNSLLTIAICDQSKVVPPIDIHYEAPQTLPLPQIHIIEEDSDSESESEDYLYNNGNVINNVFGMYEDYDSEPEPVIDVNELFGMFQDYNSDDSECDMDTETQKEPLTPTIWPHMGFDVITQENDVLLHKMPCGHEMNHESLYSYALSTFSDSNMHLKCPHNIHTTNNSEDTLCDSKWQYSSITDVLRYKTPKNKKKLCDFLDINNKNKNEWINHAKLEILASRNVIENDGNFQKCPRCDSLYFRNSDTNRKDIEDIKTIEDIENEFKFKCVVCPAKTEEIIERIDFKQEREEKGHFEDDIIEDINGSDINIMFGYDNNSDSDSDTETDEENEENEALHAISTMFDDDGIDFIENINIKHLNVFCYCCGKEWEDLHVCDTSFKDDLCEILGMAELKKIGSVENVPSIRCCPECCQLIFHVDACKHMKCGNCKIDFCFVCMKPKKDGSWQCGCHSDACPVAPAQNMDTLPDTIVISKKTFQLY